MTGPSGGPALTDVLGVCVAWEADTCVIQPESGAAVTIALRDVVSGKPVPPRPSARHRVSTRDAEARTASLWAGIERESLGAWQLRHDPAPVGRPRKRANSCLAIGEPGVPVAEALDAVVAFYAARGRDPLVQIEAGSQVEDALVAAGWVALTVGETEMRIASVSRVRRSLPRSAHPVELTVADTRAVASAGTGCDPVAEGSAAVDGDWLGLHGLAVDPGHRRRGLASAVVGELLDWGAERGALTAWLHVETDNPAGTAFWAALGFEHHHTCRYYAPPSAASASPVSR